MSETTDNPNPPRKGIRKGIYIVPSLFTIANIFCGFYAIMNSAKAFQLGVSPKAFELFDTAAIAIGLAVLFDGLDGRIARMTKTTSEFGVELDSIADVVTFGVAPAVLAYTWGYGNISGLDRYGWGISFFFMICGALRLARFNVLARAPKFSQVGSSPKLDKRYFVGLPIPPSAGVLAAVVHFHPQPLTVFGAESQVFFGWCMILGLGTLGVLMVSTLRYSSFKDFGGKRVNPFVVLPLFALLIGAIWFESRIVLLVLSTVYVTHGPVMKLFGLLGRLTRQSQTGKELAEPTSVE